MVKLKDVHTEHCCIDHGCKYGDDNCTVVTGKLPQSFPCEDCEEEDTDTILNELGTLISELFNDSGDDWCATADISLAVYNAGYRKVL
jgi:hypothetical protein